MKTKASVLDSSKPIQRFFEEISAIPRQTEDEKAISDFIVSFAEERGLYYRRDELLNVLVRKPASKGYEGAKPVILQAHMDMVCAKTNDSSHDFSKDPIELVLEGSRLRANGTSLGADDGFGVAYILAILDDANIKHPELECVFTAQEEHKTMVGAEHFDASDLKSKRMIGLDGDGEIFTFVGSACSSLITIEKDLNFVPVKGTVCTFEICKVTGSVLRGVVSQECGNAIKMSIRLLAKLLESGVKFQLCSINGGIGENRNPLNCKVVFAYDPVQKKKIQYILEAEFNQMMNEYDSTTYMAELQFDENEQTSNMISDEDSRQIITMLYLLPNNLFRCNAKTNEFESVNNLGIIKTEEQKLVADMSIRSVRQSIEDELIVNRQIIHLCFGIF